MSRFAVKTTQEAQLRLHNSGIAWFPNSAPKWEAKGVHLCYGPLLVKSCATELGAKVAVWRRTR